MFDKFLSMFLVPNVPGLWIYLSFEFWIYPSSEYASGFEYVRILNLSELWICQGYSGCRICLNNSWLYLNMPDYLGKCLNIPEYAGICVNVPKSFWIAFVSHFPCGYITLHAVIYLEVYRRLGYSLKKMRQFSWKDKIWHFL